MAVAGPKVVVAVPVAVADLPESWHLKLTHRPYNDVTEQNKKTKENHE